MVAEKSEELLAAEAELERQRQAREEEIILSEPEAAVGKALSDAIQKAKREFIREWETIPSLVLIHPADFRALQYYSMRREIFTYMYVRQGEENCIPNDASLRVMTDCYRERGTFLVTTRKSLERSGVNGTV